MKDRLDLKDPFAWGLYFLQHRLDVRCSPMHPQMTAALSHPTKLKACVIGFRWGAKSTWTVQDIVLHRSTEDPLPLIRISSNTADKAKDNLRIIRTELRENKFLLERYGWLTKKWLKDNEDELILPNECETRILAKGFMHLVRGDHPLLDLFDDIQTYEDCKSGAMRKSYEDRFFGTVAGSWIPQTRVGFVANFTHPLCFAKALYDNITEAKPFEFTQGVDLSDWTALKFESGYHKRRPVWPAKWPLEELERQRRTMGWQKFDAEFENKPEFFLEPVIKPEWFRRHAAADISRTLLNDASLFLKYDAAFSLKDSADEFAAAVFARFHSGPFEGETKLLKGFANRAPLDDNARAVLQLVEDFGGRPVVLHFEREGKDTIVFQQALERIARAELVQVRQKVVAREEFPGDKRQRLMAVSGMFQSGEVSFEENLATTIENQILMLGEGDRDDWVDVVTDGCWYSKKLATKDRKTDYYQPVAEKVAPSLTTHAVRARSYGSYERTRWPR